MNKKSIIVFYITNSKWNTEYRIRNTEHIVKDIYMNETPESHANPYVAETSVWHGMHVTSEISKRHLQNTITHPQHL